jgi:hypothetical protein
MSGQPREKLSTADMVSASQQAADQPSGEPAPPPEERPDESPTNVRKLERPGRPPADAAVGERPGALLAGDEVGELRHRWETIQTGFVDEPRRAVQEADSLVAQTMTRLAEVFSRERSTLEQQWSSGQDVSTEDLRVSMKRYRSFFDRLLAV